MIKNKYVDMIMVAHVFNKNLDAKYPASMSSRIINDLLRTKMKYEGVVITDAIDMYALSHNFTLEEIVINSINAGADIILHANQMQYDKDVGQKIYNIIIEAVYNGLISEERIHKSYQRINKMTNQYNL